MKNSIQVKVKQPEFDIALARVNSSRGACARAIDLSEQWFSKVANGEESVSPKVRQRIIDYLNVDAAIGYSFDDIFFIENVTNGTY